VELQERSCPLCGPSPSRVRYEARFDAGILDDFAFASRKFPEYMHYRLIECLHCDLLYASPVFPPAEIDAAYQKASFDSSEEAAFAARTYGKLLPSLFENSADLEGALDIGTGDGAFLEVLLQKGFINVKGVESSLAPIRAAKDPIKALIQQGPFRISDFQPNSLRLVTCFQTLEHLSDPMAVCRTAYKLLKPQGGFLSVCHNRRSFSAGMLGRRSPIFDIEHLQLFSPKSARFLLEECGFERVVVRSFFNLYPLHYWIKLFPFPAVLKKSLVGWLKKTGLGQIPIGLPAGNMALFGFKKG
jgi:SAM-dependent methyltransferase